jgi:hypothetical protein
MHPLRIFIGIDGGRGWCRGPHSRRWCSFDIGGILLAHFFFFMRVAEDDDVAIAGRPEDVAVEVTKKSSAELLIT